MRVAVIGAGASGLTALKCCLDEGLEAVCYERTNDIGGLWRYSDEVTEGQSCVMKTTVINTSKEMMSYSDCPIPAEYPIYMHNTMVQKYFHHYADQFMLKKHIQFGKEILNISKNSSFVKTGQWDVKVKDSKSGKVEDLVFDAVMVCTGHHADKNVPDFPGLSNFKGKVVHSHDYRTTAGFEDKRNLVIGIGNSGGDLAVELSRVGSKSFLSTRRGSWIFYRIEKNGMPLDMVISTRIFLALRNLIPASVFESLMQRHLNSRFDHTIYNLKPKHNVFSQHPTVNDELANRLASGTLKLKPDVKTFTENGVIFEDGTKEDIDMVVLATGYKFGFPFVDKSVIDVKENRVELYKYVFPPMLENPTLCVIGCFQPFGAIMPISEMQCRWATRVFQRKLQLPSNDEMMTDIKNKADAMSQRFVKSPRHTIQVDYVDYMDEIAGLAGNLPDLKSFLLRDPKLAFACFFGPCTPYQYRLSGPGTWDGARNAILTQWDRVYDSLKGRPLDFPEQHSKKKMFILFVILIAAFCIFLQVKCMK